MARGSRTAALALVVLTLAASATSAETLGEAYRRVNPAVVVIRARGQEVEAAGVIRFREIGSGVLITPDGKVATAAHVVHSMNEIMVEYLGEEPVKARVI